MKLIVKENYEEASKAGAQIFIDAIKANPSITLGLATGSSPIGIYQNLIKANKNGEISFKNVKTVNLDEYVNLPVTHPESYRAFMNKQLFDQVDIDKAQTNVPCGLGNAEENCKAYDEIIAKNPQSIQLLGIGSNGHIAFNEPGTPFDSNTHVVTLKDSTRKDNARFFASIDEVPTHAITMGIKGIMGAKRIVLIATGANKADAIARLINGEITTDCPATILQKHPDVTIIVDKAAASKL